MRNNSQLTFLLGTFLRLHIPVVVVVWLDLVICTVAVSVSSSQICEPIMHYRRGILALWSTDTIANTVVKIIQMIG